MKKPLVKVSYRITKEQKKEVAKKGRKGEGQSAYVRLLIDLHR